MAEKDERYYDIITLNRLFAITSVIFAASLIWMFQDDYDRTWKTYQREFREIEEELTWNALKTEHGKLAKNSDLKTIEQKLAKADLEIEKNADHLYDLEDQLKIATAENYKIAQEFQRYKAQFDEQKYRFEYATVYHSDDAQQYKNAMRDLTSKMDELASEVERTEKEVEKIENEIKTIKDQSKKLEREYRSLTAKFDLLDTKLSRVELYPEDLGQRVANVVRDLPVLDFMNPYYKIKQIVISDVTENLNFVKIPKVDRCETCHLGITRPEYEKIEQPFTTHPDLDLFLSSNSPHPVEQFGCTACHSGRDRGTDFVSTVHMPDTFDQKEEWHHDYDWHKLHHWEKPMYPKRYIEAGCFKCHSGSSELKGADKLSHGLALIERTGCFGCHNIDKYLDREKVGPDLTKIASKIEDRSWTKRWIKDPTDFRHNTWMPKFFGLLNNRHAEIRNDQEINAITRYLYNHSSDFAMNDLPVKGDRDRGEELVKSVGCLGCHKIQPEPSAELTEITEIRHDLRLEQGPNLIGVATKTSAKWIYNWIKDPKKYNPKTRMPDLRLTDQESADITAYLMTLDQNFKKTQVADLDRAELMKIAIEFLEGMMHTSDAKSKAAKMSDDEMLEFAGTKLVRHYGCYGCHVIDGFEKDKPIGADLSEHGSKMTKKLDFGLIEWIDTHTGDPLRHRYQANFRWFAQKLKNPRIWDTNAEISAQTDQILHSEKVEVVRIKKSTELTKMPKFDFTDREAEAIVTALLGFVKPEVLPTKIAPRSPKNLYVEKGQALVREFNCASCHVMEGDGGSIQPTIKDWLIYFDDRDETDARSLTASYSPPNLIGEGKKVQTDWLFQFFRDPSPLRPWLKVRMPTFNFSEEEVNTLVKYFSYLDDEDFPFADQVTPHFTADRFDFAKTLLEKDFQCVSCHIKGGELPSGSPANWAPDLAMAKDRLKPNWIIDWLLDPSTLLPGTKMPSYFDPENLSDDEMKQIHALRDYLLVIE